MVDGLATALVGLGLALALVAFVLAALGRLAPKPYLQGLLLLQAGVLAQGLVLLVRVGDWDGPVAELLGYLAVAVLLLPGALVLSAEERSRWGTAVLGAGCLALAVVVVRLTAVWDAGTVA